MTNLNDEYIDDFIENPKKFDQHLEEIMNRIEKHMRETANESCKKFFERHGL